MSAALFFSLYMLVCSIHRDKEETFQKIKLEVEKAYFKGQYDAINGNVRIKMGPDSIYVWSKSPWTDGSPAIYKPGKIVPE